jgi:hypothetical protein
MGFSRLFYPFFSSFLLGGGFRGNNCPFSLMSLPIGQGLPQFQAEVMERPFGWYLPVPVLSHFPFGVMKLPFGQCLPLPVLSQFPMVGFHDATRVFLVVEACW